MRFFGKKNYRSHNGVADMEVWLPADVFRVLLARSLVSGGEKAMQMFGKSTTLFLTSTAKSGRAQWLFRRHGRPFLSTRHVGLADKAHHVARKGVAFLPMKWAYFFGKVHHYCPFSSFLRIGKKVNLLRMSVLQKWRKRLFCKTPAGGWQIFARKMTEREKNVYKKKGARRCAP